MKLIKILTIVFFAASLFLCFKLYRSVQGTIEEREEIRSKEKQLIERLKLIREAEINFRNVYGKYTSNWDSLISFVENGKVPIIQRREEIIMKAYGGEEVKIHIDTLGFKSAKENIFKKNYTLNASDNGIFMGFRVKVGDQVRSNQKAFSFSTKDGKVQTQPFISGGKISGLARISVSDAIRKGQIIVQYWDYQFNPNTDVSKLSEIPYLLGEKLDIYVGYVDRNGVKVNVIEVKDPKPVDISRSIDNEAISRKPLGFGSRVDVSTAGNWE